MLRLTSSAIVFSWRIGRIFALNRGSQIGRNVSSAAAAVALINVQTSKLQRKQKGENCKEALDV